MKKERNIIWTSIFTAVAASLCCITPVLALISGVSGAASTFSWMEPFRPYLIGVTVVVLAFAWHQILKPKNKNEIDCECEEDEKSTFIQTKTFLGIVTVFAAIMLAFPYYSTIFYPNNKKEVAVVSQSTIQSVVFKVKGMTCTSCEEHVKHAVNELDGILNVIPSFESGNTKIAFDNTKTSVDAIKKAIDSTGYKVIEKNEK